MVRYRPAFDFNDSVTDAKLSQLLERVVKRDNAVIANLTASTKAEEADSSSLIQIPVLKVDRTRRKLVSCTV